ncbi:MAG: hypothetical protein H7Y41_05210 [Hyphomonadaceae bacterium]|nr:hypothetical protein [Clostridia bacterium]
MPLGLIIFSLAFLLVSMTVGPYFLRKATIKDISLESVNMGNNKIISLISDLRDSKIKVDIGGITYEVGTFEEYTKEITTELAMESANATQKNDSQQLLTTSVNNRRISISGVSIDEEMTNMIQFQHAYSAAASMIKKIDENLDILINRLG